jgi:RNA polymerase sigma-32 factor
VARLRGRCLSRALAQLPEREREIVRARHLAEDEDALTLEVLGQRLGVSKERVRQLEARAMDKLAALVRACAGGDGRAVLA